MWIEVNEYSINLNKINVLSSYSKYGDYQHNRDKICYYVYVLLDGGRIDIEFETEEQCRAEIDRIKEIASKALVEK
ncbi:MAG: hypothetical protein H6632_02545 [Anaerolineales bacterium]|nr:hypothetical protein [Anaerolineales bacterium]